MRLNSASTTPSEDTTTVGVADFALRRSPMPGVKGIRMRTYSRTSAGNASNARKGCCLIAAITLWNHSFMTASLANALLQHPLHLLLDRLVYLPRGRHPEPPVLHPFVRHRRRVGAELP